MLRYVLNVLMMLALAVWIGSLVFFGAGVASTLFGSGVLPDRTMAGAVNSAILGRLGVIELISGVLLFSGALYMAFRGRRWENWAVFALSIIMLATAAYYTTILFPEMDALRTAIGSFEQVAAEKAPLREAFNRGHQLYSTLVKGVLFAGVLTLVLNTISLVRTGNAVAPRRNRKGVAETGRGKLPVNGTAGGERFSANPATVDPSGAVKETAALTAGERL